MRTLRLTLEYDGTDFGGWARQPDRRTIEGAVRDALDGVFPEWRDLAVAGRTDAGVHATGQVISVVVEGGPPTEHVAEALNRRLPPDLAARDSRDVPSDFNARFSAHARAYRYRISNARTRPALDRRALWYPRPLDKARLDKAAAMIVGHHDFRAFTPTETEHHTYDRAVRLARWDGEAGGMLVFHIVADGFLRHMVRTLVGTMIQREPSELGKLLAGAPRDRAGRTAAAVGLWLDSVAYTPAEVATLGQPERCD